MANQFGMNQKLVDGKQRAEIIIAGCGRKDIPGLEAVIWIERKGDKITMYVWGDIAQDEPTHIIDLSDALETNRE